MIWYLQEPNKNNYPVWTLAQLGILQISCVCTTLQPHSIEGLWVERQQYVLPIERHVESSLYSSGFTLQSRIITKATMLTAHQVIARAYS